MTECIVMQVVVVKWLQW